MTARFEAKTAIETEAVPQSGGPGVALPVARRGDDAAHQDEVIERAIETFGSADLLVNNTGINPVYGSLLVVDLDAARKILDAVAPAAVKSTDAGWMTGQTLTVDGGLLLS